jgi:hypothetical protein
MEEIFDIKSYTKKLHELKPPAIHDEWRTVYDSMVIHTQGVFPADLVGKRRPNEAKEVYDYRQKNYSCITKGEIHKNIDAVYRILTGSNYKIGYTDQLKQFLDNKYFYGYDFINFIHYYILIADIEDPNAILCWVPTGEMLPNEKVDVDAVVVNSCNIINIDDDIFTWKDDENKYFSLTKTDYYSHIRNVKTGKFDTILIYYHNIKSIPAIVLKGNIKIDHETGEIYYDSFFEGFRPFANDAINIYDDWKATMTTSGFPYRVETASNCDNPACRGGYVVDDNNVEEQCETCQGTGKKIINRSPYGVFFRNKPNVLDAAAVDPILPITFVSPDVSTIINQRESWQLLLKMASENLNMRPVDEAQSGIAKLVDKENQQYSFLSKISNNLYDNIVFNSVYFLEAYRDITYSASKNVPKVVKPTSFDIKNQADIMTEMSEMKSKSVPRIFMIESGKELTKKRFNNNDIAQHIHDLITSTDILYGKDDTEVSIIKSQGYFKTEIFQYHYAIESVLYQLIQETPDIFSKSIADIKATVILKLPEYANAEPKVLFSPEGESL